MSSGTNSTEKGQVETLVSKFMATPSGHNVCTIIDYFISKGFDHIAFYVGQKLFDRYRYNLQFNLLFGKTLYNLERYRDSHRVYSATLKKFPNLSPEDREKILLSSYASLARIVGDISFPYRASKVEAVSSRQVSIVNPVCVVFEVVAGTDYENSLNSFLNCCTDVESVNRWYCLCSDDEARMKIERVYPFFQFLDPREGLPLDKLSSYYMVMFNSNWVMFNPRSYISDSLELMETVTVEGEYKVGQVCFNQDFSSNLVEYVSTVHSQPRESLTTKFFLHTPMLSETPEAVAMKEEILKRASEKQTRNIFSEMSFNTKYMSMYNLGILSKVAGLVRESKSGESMSDIYEREGYRTVFLEGMSAVIQKDILYDLREEYNSLKNKFSILADNESSAKAFVEKNKSLLNFSIEIDCHMNSTVSLRNIEIERMFHPKSLDRDHLLEIILCLKSYQSFLKSDKESMIVVSETADLRSDFLKVFIESLKQLKLCRENGTEVDVVYPYLNYLQPQRELTTSCVLENRKKIEFLQDVSKKNTLLHCHIITRSGAKKVLEYIDKNGIQENTLFFIHMACLGMKSVYKTNLSFVTETSKWERVEHNFSGSEDRVLSEKKFLENMGFTVGTEVSVSTPRETSKTSELESSKIVVREPVSDAYILDTLPSESLMTLHGGVFMDSFSYTLGLGKTVYVISGSKLGDLVEKRTFTLSPN